MLLASPPATWVRYNKPTKLIWLCIGIFLLVIITSGPHDWDFVDCKLDGTCESASSTAAKETRPSICDAYPDPGNIAIVVKTAAWQALDRLPTQLITSLQCVKQPLIFSDLEQTLGRHRIHDALASVLPDAIERNANSDLYREQKRLVASNRANELSKLQDLNEDAKVAALAGLDKYKILHMIEQAFKLQPEQDWYVFVEDDTYLIWPNLLAWLKTLDASKELFFGLPLQARDDTYAGTSAFVLSLASLHKINHGLASQWDTRISNLPSAHAVLAQALADLKIPLTDASSLLSPNPLSLLPFSQSTWCKPLITIPQVSLRHMHSLHQHHLSTHSSIHNATSLSPLPFARSDWDNLSTSPTFSLEVVNNTPSAVRGNWEPKDLISPHSNFEACEIACISNKRCLQFMFATTGWEKREEERECFLSSVWRVGVERKTLFLDGDVEGRRGNRAWRSGWRVDRIGRVVEGGGCEGDVVGWSRGG